MEIFDAPHPDLKGHPLVNPGGPTVGIISVDHPVQPPQIDEAEFSNDLDLAGLTHQKTTSDYGGPENCYLVYGATRDQTVNWARQLGQAYAIWSNNGQSELLCICGPTPGTLNPSLPQYGFSKERPNGYHTELPGLGFIRLYFDSTRAQPTPTLLRKHSHHHHPAGGGTMGAAPQPAGMLQVPDGTAWLMGGVRSALTGLGAVTHAVAGSPPEHDEGGEHTETRHSHEWHDGHTQHHLPARGQGVAVPPSHMANRVAKAEAAPIDYRYLCQPFGVLDPGSPSDPTFYSVSGRQPAIDRLLRHHGYTHIPTTPAGKVDRCAQNYNTRALVVPFTGKDEIDSWRVLHELGHGLTHLGVNQEYGEGRRVGQVGVDLSLREALRAVAWEAAAVTRQRGLLADIGVTISDDAFNQELNYVLADAVCRVVTGKPVDLARAGFRPHSFAVPVQAALDMVREAASATGSPETPLAKIETPNQSLGQYMLNHFAARNPPPSPGVTTFQAKPNGGFAVNLRTAHGDFTHHHPEGRSEGAVQWFTNSPRRDTVPHAHVVSEYPQHHDYLTRAAQHVARAHATLNEFAEP